MQSFETLCRICLDTKIASNLIPFHSTLSYKNVQMPISDMFVACTSICLNNEFPNFICKPCETKLISAYRFRQECIDADEKIREKLIDHKNCFNTVEACDYASSDYLEDQVSTTEEYTGYEHKYTPTSDISNELNHSKAVVDCKMEIENCPKDISTLLECDICRKKFTTKKQIAYHMKMHKHFCDFKCTDCNLGKTLLYHLKKIIILTIFLLSFKQISDIFPVT